MEDLKIFHIPLIFFWLKVVLSKRKRKTKARKVHITSEYKKSKFKKLEKAEKMTITNEYNTL